MENKIKSAFDNIRAEEKLKNNTAEFIRENREKGQRRKNSFKFRIMITTFASLLILFGFSYNLYFTSYAYVGVDVNPSIELGINRFNKVVDTYGYNSEGEEILSKVNVKHLNYEDAIEEIMDEFTRKGYLKNDDLVSVTIVDESKKDKIAVQDIETRLMEMASNHHISIETNLVETDEEIRRNAHHLNLSPAKYLAILKLKEVDAVATFESCSEHSIAEIKQLTDEHHSSNDDFQEIPNEENHNKGHH